MRTLSLLRAKEWKLKVSIHSLTKRSMKARMLVVNWSSKFKTKNKQLIQQPLKEARQVEPNLRSSKGRVQVAVSSVSGTVDKVIDALNSSDITMTSYQDLLGWHF